MKLCRICGNPAKPHPRATLCESSLCRRTAKTEWQLKWQRENPKRHGVYTKLTRERNPDLRRARRALGAGKGRAEKYGVERVPYTAQDLIAMLPDGCHICGGHDGVIGWDHVVPMQKGGSDSLTNIRPAHWSCNRKKGVRNAE